MRTSGAEPLRRKPPRAAPPGRPGSGVVEHRDLGVVAPPPVPADRDTSTDPLDVAHFARALDPTTGVPEDLRRLPRPIIGFFGLLADWVDMSLVRELALARPGWSFALIGKATTDLGALRGLANVYLLGQKPYSVLPGYCRGFDVGIIPFRRNELTIRANPLKLREYLAAGVPVVSTRLPEVARYEGLVHLADGVEGFLTAISAALGQRSEERRV